MNRFRLWLRYAFVRASKDSFPAAVHLAEVSAAALLLPITISPRTASILGWYKGWCVS